MVEAARNPETLDADGAPRDVDGAPGSLDVAAPVADAFVDTDALRTVPGAAARGRPSVERVAAALEIVAYQGWVTAAGLASAMGVDRSTGWRLARSLERVGWLRQDAATGRYRLGIRLFELGTRVLDTVDVRDEARRVMTELVASTGESVDLAIRDGDSVVFIDKIDGTHEVRAFTRSGQRAPLHATAAGKVFLAAMPDGAVRSYLAGPLAALTPVTNTDPVSLLATVEETRRRGWAINRGELHLEAGALAVPVLDASGVCVAALGLNVPLSRLDDDRVRVLVAELQSATNRLTPTFGFDVARSPGAMPPVP